VAHESKTFVTVSALLVAAQVEALFLSDRHSLKGGSDLAIEILEGSPEGLVECRLVASVELDEFFGV
jgi:hypothetical protein